MVKENKKDWGAVRDAIQEELDAEKLDVMGADEDDVGESSAHHDEKTAALDHPAYVELEQQLTLAEQKAHENWEKSVRAMAEVDNIRRRAERDVSNAHRFALEKFAMALIPVVDSLEQALQLASQHGDDAMREGLALTTKLMIDTLDKFEVKQINPEGELFDPQQHEAMSILPSDDAQPNTILNVFQKGYVLNERVIRPARVIVAKG
jgi:molecular chaperone GrpE